MAPTMQSMLMFVTSANFRTVPARYLPTTTNELLAYLADLVAVLERYAVTLLPPHDGTRSIESRTGRAGWLVRPSLASCHMSTQWT